jgi:hypothetical protein
VSFPTIVVNDGVVNDGVVTDGALVAWPCAHWAQRELEA